ncbi:hypothetical protein [Paraburkholderia sp. J67]|uniref:hypothetical protein n=1 Tax=Paraburkholderia sp. J67 TaxID=2805435 RepID=UPI002ABD27A2|nr:hypothetical protein [Paraburkholderia sp. J67]
MLPDAFTASVIVIYVAGVLFGPIVNGHDTYVSFSHIDIWVNALRAGDLVSIWTPADANGFGSPVPFFYHKLFNIVAAVFTLLTGDVVTGARLAILFFAALMFYGASQCAARLGADARSRHIIAIASVLSPYAVLCVTLRGAYAEYSAMTLVPYGIALTLDFFNKRARAWHAIVLLIQLLLIAAAHVVTFVFADGLLILCALYLLLRSPRQGLPLLAVGVSAVLAFVVLIYVPFVIWSAYFCPGQASIHGLTADNAVAFYRIFSPNPGSWFGWPVSMLVVGLALQMRRRRDPRSTTVIATGAIACVLLVMTTQLASPLWRQFPVFGFIQFPWRLLSLISPIAFVAFAGVIEQLKPATKRKVQIALLAITLINTAGLLHALKGVFTLIPVAELRHQIPTGGPGPDAGGEYLPARYQAQLSALPDLFKVGANAVLPARRPLVESTGDCTFSTLAPVNYFRELRIDVRCQSAGVVTVNQFDTPFLDVTASDHNGAISRPQGGTPFITLPLSPGEWVIRVRQRTYMELVGMAWSRKLHTWSGKF